MKRTTDLEALSTTVGTRNRSSLQKWIVLLVVVVICAAGGYFLMNGLKKKDDTDKKASKQDRVVPVTVATARTDAVPIEIHSIGNVLPYSTVNVIPQASGQLTKVCFTQGQYVKKGQLLFQIDPRPYQAALDQALGNCARDEAQIQQAQANKSRDIANVGQLQANKQRDMAQAKYADVEVGRYATLVQQGAVSHEQSDQVNTNLATAQATIDADQKAIENAQAVVNADNAAIETAKGTLKADQAAAQNARIQLGWTQIRSPIDGRTSSLNVYQGNIVTANSNQPLVSIAQVQPIYVNFTVPEQNLDVVRSNLASGKLEVDALIEGVKADAVKGNVSFLESTVNTTTGTIVMRAAF
ncbi:MAG TPA: biotin/lipoyl-binding protein, partial [Chroococcales cyanobacterium]